MIPPETRGLVRIRAEFRCEYCLLQEHHSPLVHHIEHIVARQHNGSNDASNLALACHRCNLRKGPNLTAIDHATGKIVPLFHPRKNAWPDHFKLDGPRIEGITPTGRASVRLLTMNDERRLELRQELLRRGVFLT